MNTTTRKTVTGTYNMNQLRGLCAFSALGVDSAEYAEMAALRSEGIARIMADADAYVVEVVNGEIVGVS